MSVTDRPAAATARDGLGGPVADHAPTGADEPPIRRTIDPRAVRVALGPAHAHVALDPMVVEPPTVPIVPTHSVLGVGILGGTVARPIDDADALDSVSPPRVLVDGAASGARLDHTGPGRATLRDDAPDVDPAAHPAAMPGTPVRILFEAVEAPADGRGAARREVVVDGWRIELEIESERRAALRDRARRGREESARGGPMEVHAIIPGRIVSVSVASGDAVVASQQLLVVEAMKMQNELRAPRDGTVSKIAVAPGDTIEIGDLLLVLE